MSILKKLSLTAVAISAAVLIANTAIADTADESNESYSIKIYNNCKLIKEMPLNKEQKQAYLALMQAEDEMDTLEQPIHAIEEKLELLTKQIEKYSELAFTDTEQSFHIDRTALAEQKKYVSKLDKLMAIHQKDFDALSEQGKKIGKVADKFSTLIEDSIAGFEHDQISINNQKSGSYLNDCRPQSNFS